MSNPQSTAWNFYVLASCEDGMGKFRFGPCEESVVRTFSSEFGRFRSDESGMANVLFEQMWTVLQQSAWHELTGEVVEIVLPGRMPRHVMHGGPGPASVHRYVVRCADCKYFLRRADQMELAP